MGKWKTTFVRFSNRLMCWFSTFPSGCLDLLQHLMHHFLQKASILQQGRCPISSFLLILSSGHGSLLSLEFSLKRWRYHAPFLLAVTLLRDPAKPSCGQPPASRHAGRHASGQNSRAEKPCGTIKIRVPSCGTAWISKNRRNSLWRRPLCSRSRWK